MFNLSITLRLCSPLKQGPALFVPSPAPRGSLWPFLHTPLPEDASSPKTVYNGATQEAAVPQFPRKWSMFRGT